MVLGFVVVMDALKYIFHIDPVRGEREQLRREQMAKKKKKPVIIRFKYVDHPPAITITEETVWISLSYLFKELEKENKNQGDEREREEMLIKF